MLKRLFAALRGSKIITPETQAPPAAAEAPPAGEEKLMSFYDTYGRQIMLTRNAWRENVLLPNLEAQWDTPERLCQLIVAALTDDFAVDVLHAAQHLVEIDPNSERGHTMHGIVFLKNGMLDEAEATLRAGIAKVGETAMLLTNLAKVIFERGERVRSEEILRAALDKDPNFENALMWWLAIERDRDLDAGYLNGLLSVSNQPGSWRAQLWLARHYLAAGDVARARRLYEDVLAGKSYDSEALTMISGDLGNSGQMDMILQLVAPAYEPGRHDPNAGLNLLRAFHALRLADQGQALLDKMYALDLTPFKQNLDQFAQAFQQLRVEADTVKAIDPDQVEMSYQEFIQPVWQYGLRGADWLFHSKPDDALHVGFMAFSKSMGRSEVAEVQREDTVGRLTRAIPLYLSEAVHYWTDFAATTYLLVAEGRGPVVFGSEMDEDQLFDFAPKHLDWLVTGQIECNSADEAGEWTVSVRLWNCAKRELAATETETCVQKDLGAAVLTMERRLLAHLGRARSTALDDFYKRPSTEAMEPYLVHLGQSFLLTLCAGDAQLKSNMWNERAMLDWPLTMALQWPDMQVLRLMYVAGLSNAMDYGSDALPEYKNRTLQLLSDKENAETPAARMMPLIWKIFGMDEQLAIYRRDLPSDTGAAYREWVERIAKPTT